MPKRLSDMIPQLALLVATVLWASAFVGIRMGLQGYSPGPLALLRFLVASICMLLICMILPARRRRLTGYTRFLLLVIGILGLGCYNITLNTGETVVASGVASFIISLSPVITVIFASLFLGERFNIGMIAGMLISISGVGLIALAETHEMQFNTGLIFMLVATLTCGLYSVMQKPFLTHYHAIEVTAWIIWGCTLLLLFYLPGLLREWHFAPGVATGAVIYLGIFPAAMGYVAWSYGLRAISASKAAGYLYLMPVFASLMGWWMLGEVPALLSLLGGFIILMGVWILSHHQRKLFTQDAFPG